MTDLSFVVCTRDRAAALTPCLDAIAAAARAAPGVAAELVLVDNGSTDGTGEAVRAWAAGPGAGLPVRLVREERRGLSAARNAGVAAAAGRLLAFTDDDCRPVEAYVRELLAHDAADAGPVLRGGRVELGDPADLPYTVKTEDEARTWHPGLHLGGFILGCNMAIRREGAARIGPFDERFGAGGPFRAGEDSDWMIRAHLAGIPVAYVPDMAVRHFHGRRDPAEGLALNAGYVVGEGALYAKYLARTPVLTRQLWWDVRASLRELFDPAMMSNTQLGLRHRHRVGGNVRGMLAYWRWMLRGT